MKQHNASLPQPHLAEGKAVVPVQQHTADTPSISPLGVVALNLRSACITCSGEGAWGVGEGGGGGLGERTVAVVALEQSGACRVEKAQRILCQVPLPSRHAPTYL